MSVGFTRLEQPLTGDWPYSGYPTRVLLFGRKFLRSKQWTFPYAGVAAQYREERDRDAMHLMVSSDGTYVIDHIDEANPERGLVLEHALKDALHTPVGALVLLGVVVAGVAGVSWLLTRP